MNMSMRSRKGFEGLANSKHSWPLTFLGLAHDFLLPWKVNALI